MKSTARNVDIRSAQIDRYPFPAYSLISFPIAIDNCRPDFALKQPLPFVRYRVKLITTKTSKEK